MTNTHEQFAQSDALDDQTGGVATPLEGSSARREVAGGIRGWRGWRLVHDFGQARLQSVSAPDIWRHPVFTAHEPPSLTGRSHSAGIHAYAAPGQMRSVLSGPALVYGEVTLYGQVCAHAGGYRAECARIDRLFLRACGRHRPTPAPAWTGGDIFMLMAELERQNSSYCGCSTLTPQEWLSFDELKTLAEELGVTYQCEVTLDTERARASSRSCPIVRRPTYTTPETR